MASALSLQVLTGDDFKRSFTVQDSDGNAIDISAWTFLAQLRERPDGDLEETFSTSVTNGAAGQFDLTLTDTQTAGMTPGTYVWDLQRTDASGDVQTLLAGSTLQVIQDVSRT